MSCPHREPISLRFAVHDSRFEARQRQVVHPVNPVWPRFLEAALDPSLPERRVSLHRRSTVCQVFEQQQKLNLQGLWETRGCSPAVIAARHDDPASKFGAQAEKRRAKQVAKAEEIPDLEAKVHAFRAQAMANAGLAVPERLSPKLTRLTAGGPVAPGEARQQPAKLTPKENTDLVFALTAEAERTASGCSR